MQTFWNYLLANKDAITVLKDIVIALATASAAIVAVIGLQTWRKQIRGNAEYDLARRVLIAVYKVRDILYQSRLYGQETIELQKLHDLAHEEFHETQMSKLYDAEAQMKLELLEAEAIWGDEDDFSISFEDIHQVTYLMKSSSKIYYIKTISLEAKQLYHSILFWTWGKDEYREQVVEAVKRVDEYLRPKLTLKPKKKKEEEWKIYKQP